jgi:undecaprenyl phosphate N,N'-diacetylbacillosamine 1-phosphate transferase
MTTADLKSIQELQLLIKYGCDLLLALLLLIPVICVVLLLGVILYCDSPGPVFFRQLRPGRNGKLFAIYKLRTMAPGDHTRETPRNQDGSLALTADLAGYTRFGRLLRRFSLDELPQIFNIIKGEMSFIGPRPDLPEHLDLYTAAESMKLAVRPGLTGLAQIAGRNELPWKERLKLDVQYVKEYNLWLDLKILAGTMGKIISGKGIYAPKQ